MNKLFVYRNLCENSAPGAAIAILDKFRYHFEDQERGQAVIERISRNNIEKFSLLVPIKNLDINSDTTFWGVVSKYSRVDDEEDKLENRLYKYIDPLLSIKMVIQPSMLEVVDIEKIEVPSKSRLASFRKELENVFLDTQILNFVQASNGNFEVEQGNCFEKLDFKDFKVPLRRTVVYDSELIPKISQGKKETLIIVRSSANLKYCSNKTGSWSSEWKFEFPENNSQKKLIWNGSIYIHSYNSESGNSHLVYKKENIIVNIVSDKYSFDELIKSPSHFANQSSKMISEEERRIQSKFNDSVSEFKNKYIKKLRRILPINPIKFDWGRQYNLLQNPLNESILTNTNF
ncbi:Factin capping alpha subunit [Cryptosporidium sp. chipmunk genotype I]|uniref:Factin capping alpha subunit n=1 Tax=Cryptosporidium sp. chipmunk genotype I TaxID=1280935 RepID=UPI00351A8764|nr:Factin capping alpha subunit [Cryptosporidium sp. chipmunk genotype I]